MINKDAYFNLKTQLESYNATLIAVSKRQPVERIKLLYGLGQLDFGENQAQALVQRAIDFPHDDIRWHFIGHLQSNKVKFIVPIVHLIHSVDSIKLLKAIDKEAKKNNRIVNCLCQVHIAKEEHKFGFSEEELLVLLGSSEYKQLDDIRMCGLMGMATNIEDQATVSAEFRHLKSLFDQVKAGFFSDQEYFNILSMGMSNDYRLALEEGSNMVRVGTLVFGERDPH